MLCPATGKEVHLTKDKANSHLQALRKKLKYNGEVYPCFHCKGYHVGRKSYTKKIKDEEKPVEET